MASHESIVERYRAVRALSLAIAAPLSVEDQGVQSMPDASPTKWHLAHTSWFFETVVLHAYAPRYRVFDERFAPLFNSYYESLGPRHPRPQRGLLTRPAHHEVLNYRTHVDEAMIAFLARCDLDTWPAAAPMIELGLSHEQQHQELMLTDIKHAFSLNPLRPAWGTAPPSGPSARTAPCWLSFAGGESLIGHGDPSFSFDNEMPRHPVRLSPYALAQRPVSCGEYAEFIADGGYRRPELWLSDGWAAVQSQGWQAPLYWDTQAGPPARLFTLYGDRDVHDDEPVCHLSFYEAAAFADWAGARLPTEFEWEHAAQSHDPACPTDTPGLSLEALDPHPRCQARTEPTHGVQQRFGAVWQWTRSSYDPYPGFRPLAGAVGEYNGKFMISQVVLRGSSCATPAGHSRSTYRNFFPPGARWQFAGLRLARDL
ncbi:MAG: ergothioneine biosynthesis protein EgtB [Pseudomonadota bacterium]